MSDVELRAALLEIGAAPGHSDDYYAGWGDCWDRVLAVIEHPSNTEPADEAALKEARYIVERVGGPSLAHHTRVRRVREVAERLMAFRDSSR